MATEAELEKIRQRNATLREQIEKAKSKRAENLGETAREIEAAQLLGEQAALEAELAAAREGAKVGTVKDGNNSVLESARLRMEAAAAAIESPHGVVDTNAENQPSGTTGKVKAVKEGVVETAPDGVTTARKPEDKTTTTSSSSTSSSNTSSNGGSN